MYIAVLLFALFGVGCCLLQNEETLASKQDPYQISKDKDLRAEQIQGQPKTILNKPLRRQKRAWVLKELDVEENDEGPFPKKLYTIPAGYTIDGPGVNEEPNMGLFTQNKKSELVVNRKIDREKINPKANSTIKLNVYYNRTSESSWLGTLVICIIVKDLNDNAPQFTQKEYRIEVPENTTEEIHPVIAHDADQENHPNSDIIYTIISQTPKSSDIIAIDSKTGMVHLRGCLDYQTEREYVLKIEASDKGEPKRTNSTWMYISVSDRNNHAPTFATSTFIFSVHERERNVTGAILKVNDEDLPNTAAWRAKYSITKGDEDGHFEIHTDLKTNEGHLVLVKPHDFEAHINPEFNLEISVENEEPLFTCPSTLNLRKKNRITGLIKLIDVNDPPVFQPPILIKHLEEGLEPGYYLNKFTAVDIDKVYKSNFRYKKGFDPDDWVDVESETGVMKTKKVLDRESFYVKNNSYNVTILAIDNGTPPLTGTGTLVIILKDINDNAPFLNFTTLYMCSIHSHVTVTAVDKDNYPFSAPFTFEFLENENSIKDKWEFGAHYGNAIQLVKLQDFPVGTYSLALRIHDKQNVYNDDVLNLKICHCSDGHTCSIEAPSSTLGIVAVAIIFASLLSLLLILLSSCTSGKIKFVTFENEGISSLKKYNSECQPEQKCLTDPPRYVIQGSYRSGVETTITPCQVSECSKMESYRSRADNSKAHFQFDGRLVNDNVQIYSSETSSREGLQAPVSITRGSCGLDFRGDLAPRLTRQCRCFVEGSTSWDSQWASRNVYFGRSDRVFNVYQ